MDAFKNFAKGTVSAGYDAAAVSIVLTAGHSANFPATPFNFTWWNSTDYGDPSDDPNREICRCTAIVGETWTITRAQETTAASTKNTAGKTYKVIAGLTLVTLDEIKLSLPVVFAGDPNGTLDGQPGRMIYDSVSVRTWIKTSAAGTLTGWQ